MGTNMTKVETRWAGFSLTFGFLRLFDFSHGHCIELTQSDKLGHYWQEMYDFMQVQLGAPTHILEAPNRAGPQMDRMRAPADGSIMNNSFFAKAKEIQPMKWSASKDTSAAKQPRHMVHGQSQSFG